MHWTDRRTHRQTDARTDRPTDRPQKSLMTIGRCATRATQPNNKGRWHFNVAEIRGEEEEEEEGKKKKTSEVTQRKTADRSRWQQKESIDATLYLYIAYM